MIFDHGLTAARAMRGTASRRLTPGQVCSRVGRRLKRLDGFNFLERFAMFMGKAQLVEMSAKKLLVERYGYDEDRIERWTLGRAIKELEEAGLRKDFVVLLRDLNEHRVHVAHDLLGGDALMRKLAGSGAHRFASKSLDRALFAVEAVIVVHDFLASNDWWD